MTEHIYTITSSYPDYSISTLEFPPVDHCDYEVIGVNLNADFLITTREDDVCFEKEGATQPVFIQFYGKSDYQLNTLVAFLNGLLENTGIQCSMGDDDRLYFTSSTKIFISYSTHRARLLLGLMNYETPSNPDQFVFCTETPSVCLGNLLYLTSLEGDIIFNTTTDNEAQTPSILAIMNTFTLPHVPILAHGKNLISIKKNALQISKIKLELVDKYFQPVILLSPMTVFIKISNRYEMIPKLLKTNRDKRFKKRKHSKKLFRSLTSRQELLHEDF
jgi:hypothetical protein